MNSKFLYAATVILSIVSTLAMADEPALSRDQVKAELQQAIDNGTLQRTDYDGERRDNARVSTKSRDQVVAELAQNRAARKALTGPLISGIYNPFGLQALQTSTLPRAEVKADVREAIATGTLPRTDYDDAALLARQARAHAASATLAQRVKAKFSRSAT